MVYAARPDFYFGVAFNADPNDPSAVPVYTEMTPNVKAITPAARGRAYELGLSLPGQPVFTVRDINEYLNAANPSSPYLAGLVPYRHTSFMGMWPNGGTGNLLNSGTWRVPRDPGFESYATGSTPSWISPVGAVTPVVGTTTPRTGSKDLSLTVVGTTDVQGISFPVDCIPGRQYTTSAYIRQTSASTVGINAGGLTAGVDAFARVVANGWGNADVGGAWTNTGGAASEYAVSNGVATHSHTSVNIARMTTLAASGRDADISTQLSVPVAAVGASIRAGLVARWSAASDFYRASADFNTDGTITLQIWKRVAGVETSLASTTMGFTYDPGVSYWLRFQLQGMNLSATMWPLYALRPTSPSLTVSDASIQPAGNVGLWSRLQTGNTNTLPVAVSYDQFNGVYALEGNSTGATGAYNRVAVTYTATQPVHTITIQTRGAAVAGTVLIDDMQHEPGGSANTYTTSGPVIYPISSNLASSWQSYWMDVGFEGNCDVPCIDALTALQGTRIPAEWYAAAVASNPDAWWELSGPGPWSSRAQRTGVPALQAVASRYGVGSGVSVGNGIPIPGLNGATGVRFFPDSNVNSTTQKTTVVGTGPLLKKGSPAFTFPYRNSSGNYVGTVSFWMQATPEGATVPPIMVSFLVNQLGQLMNILDVELNFSDGTAEITYQNNVGGSTNSTQTLAFGVPGLTDNIPHHVVMTISQDATNTAGKVYVDGQLYATSTFSTTTALGGMWANPASTIEIGGQVTQNIASDVFNGTISQVMTWNKVLAAADILALYNGGAGFTGETSGARVARQLALGGYTGPSRVSTGRSTMGPPSFTGTIDLLSNFASTVIAESGAHWVAPDGAYVFEGRDDRYNRLTPTWVFGENVAGGEIPYGEDARFSVDPQYIYTDVQVTRPTGTTAYGGLVPDAITAARRFYTRTLPLTVDLADDQQVYQLSSWIFYTHNRAQQRVAVMVIDPTGLTSLWPAVLSFEVGQRVTVKRRPSAANAGAGLTMSSDYFIESVAHVGVDLEQGTWRTVLTMSPIGTAPGMTVQPWILDNSTLSVLGTTTVAGY